MTAFLVHVAHDQYNKWWDPFPDPSYAGALVHQVAL